MATILVVDDAPICREPIAASLRLAGFKTICAGNGQEALMVLQTTHVDMVLLDIAMPVMDGLATLRKIRENSLTRDLPVIMLTAVTDQRNRETAAMLRPSDFLLKSQFSLKEMLTRVEQHLRVKAAV